MSDAETRARDRIRDQKLDDWPVVMKRCGRSPHGEHLWGHEDFDVWAWCDGRGPGRTTKGNDETPIEESREPRGPVGSSVPGDRTTGDRASQHTARCARDTYRRQLEGRSVVADALALVAAQ